MTKVPVRLVACVWSDGSESGENKKQLETISYRWTLYVSVSLVRKQPTCLTSYFLLMDLCAYLCRYLVV